MKKILFISVLLFSCGRHNKPQITYIDNIITKYDTITDYSFGGVDTIYSTTPCDSFTVLVRKNDTVYIREVKKVIQTKLVTKRDTVYRQVIVNNPQPKKIDNSITAKKGSIIGNDNTMTTKKNNWWWIFLAGYLFCHVLHKILIPMIKGLNPFIGVTSRVASLFNKLNLFR